MISTSSSELSQITYLYYKARHTEESLMATSTLARTELDDCRTLYVVSRRDHKGNNINSCMAHAHNFLDRVVCKEDMEIQYDIPNRSDVHNQIALHRTYLSKAGAHQMLTLGSPHTDLGTGVRMRRFAHISRYMSMACLCHNIANRIDGRKAMESRREALCT